MTGLWCVSTYKADKGKKESLEGALLCLLYRAGNKMSINWGYVITRSAISVRIYIIDEEWQVGEFFKVSSDALGKR